MKTKELIKVNSIILFLAIFVLYFSGCGKKEEMGIGPIKDEMKLTQVIDQQLVTKGEQTFNTKCNSCHRFETRLVGPPLKDVTKRRRPEWIMNQILNPVQMTQENKIAKELFAQYLVQMTFQDVTTEDARAILEYFRAVDAKQITAN